LNRETEEKKKQSKTTLGNSTTEAPSSSNNGLPRQNPHMFPANNISYCIFKLRKVCIETKDKILLNFVYFSKTKC